MYCVKATEPCDENFILVRVLLQTNWALAENFIRPNISLMREPMSKFISPLLSFVTNGAIYK